MPPVIVLAIGMVGAAALVRWCAKEVRRVNAELDSVRARAAVDWLCRSSSATPIPANTVPAERGSLGLSPGGAFVVSWGRLTTGHPFTNNVA